MSNLIKKILSHESGPFWQFVKYGCIGVMATCVQTAVFYLLAATLLPCLKADDWAVRVLSLPSAEVTDAVRGVRFVWATAVGFVFANVFCWLMNRWFVFKPGRYAWYVELVMFFSVSGLAMALATAISWVLIHQWGLMTTLAVLVEVVVSFLFNFFIRKFVIFKG